MSDRLNTSLQYMQTQRTAFLEQYLELLRIPSVSTSPEHKDDIQRAAGWLAVRLEKIGMHNVRVMATSLHPVVYAENLAAGKDAATVLIYGHYDVQPAEPLELWKTPPFEPALRGENVYARGASDMKGQVMAALSAVECILQDAPQVNLKFFLEGEEEIGSPSLNAFLEANKELLKADVVLNLDAGMYAPDAPAISYTLRGIAAFELRVYGPGSDLHSGSYGGAVHNPAQALCELLTGMHDENGRVTLPGFYDRVQPLSTEERQRLARLPGGDAAVQQESSVPQLWGEPEYSALERIGARPTLEINGMLSGFTGAGSKTIIPSHSMAKITTRLVGDQRPDEVYEQLKAYLNTHAPKTIRWELDYLGNGMPFTANLELPALKAYIKALQTVWGREPLYIRMGGSIPVSPAMKQILGIDSILAGFGLPDDQVHAPNEKQHLPTWYRGIEALIHFFNNLG